MAWLEKQERATKPLQLQSTLASPVEAYPDGAASRHQEAAEVSNLLIRRSKLVPGFLLVYCAAHVLESSVL